MRKILLLCGLVCMAILVSCSSKDGKKEVSDDPIEAIDQLAEKISADGNDWNEEQWEEAADQLENLLESLPSPLEMEEEIKVSGALATIDVAANMHIRKAAKMIEFLKSRNGKDSSEADEDEEEISKALSEREELYDDSKVVDADMVGEDDTDYSSSSYVGNSSEDRGDSSYDELLDSYEKYIDRYISFMKKAQNGDMDALSEYPKLLNEANNYYNKLERAKGNLSTSQMQRLNRIHSKQINALQNM